MPMTGDEAKRTIHVCLKHVDLLTLHNIAQDLYREVGINSPNKSVEETLRALAATTSAYLNPQMEADGWKLDENDCGTLAYVVVQKRSDDTTPSLTKSYDGRLFFCEEDATAFLNSLEPTTRSCFEVRGVFVFIGKRVEQ